MGSAHDDGLWYAQEEARRLKAWAEDEQRGRYKAEEDRMNARSEIELLRELLTSAPVLIIDERRARILDEREALAYMAALREWHPKVKAILADGQESQNGCSHLKG